MTAEEIFAELAKYKPMLDEIERITRIYEEAKAVYDRAMFAMHPYKLVYSSDSTGKVALEEHGGI